jgi:hypothetical protein
MRSILSILKSSQTWLAQKEKCSQLKGVKKPYSHEFSRDQKHGMQTWVGVLNDYRFIANLYLIILLLILYEGANNRRRRVSLDNNICQ